MVSTAEFSECGKFRYLLTRVWDKSLPMLWVGMLNPSNASEKRSDPTVTTLIRFAKGWGYGGLYITNHYALVSSSPKALEEAEDPVGPHNEHWQLEALQFTQAALVAWGNYPVPKKKVDALILMIQKSAQIPMCMGVTKSGAPKHPLARGKHRIPATQQLEVWVPTPPPGGELEKGEKR